MSFDYDKAEDTSDEVVRGVAAEMSDSALKPLTDAEIAEREEWLAEHRARVEQERLAAEQHRLDRERQRASEEAKAARARQQLAQLERTAEINGKVRDRTLSDLRLHAAGQERRQRELDNALRHNAQQQATTTLMAELDRAINESAPLTKPSPNFSTLYRQNQRSGWFYVTPEDSDE
jgi:hypothetical protein